MQNGCVSPAQRVSNLTAVRTCVESLLLEYQQQAGSFHTDEVALKQFVLSDWKLRQIIKLHRVLTLPPLAHSIAHHNLLLVGSIGTRLTLLVRLALFLTGAGLAASGIEKPIHPVFINVSTKATPFDQFRAAFRTLLTEDRKIAIVCTVCVLYSTLICIHICIHLFHYSIHTFAYTRTCIVSIIVLSYRVRTCSLQARQLSYNEEIIDILNSLLVHGHSPYLFSFEELKDIIQVVPGTIALTIS